MFACNWQRNAEFDNVIIVSLARATTMQPYAKLQVQNLSQKVYLVGFSTNLF